MNEAEQLNPEQLKEYTEVFMYAMSNLNKAALNMRIVIISTIQYALNPAPADEPMKAQLQKLMNETNDMLANLKFDGQAGGSTVATPAGKGFSYYEASVRALALAQQNLVAYQQQINELSLAVTTRLADILMGK